MVSLGPAASHLLAPPPSPRHEGNVGQAPRLAIFCSCPCELSANPFSLDSTSNPFGAGSPFKPDGLNNPFSPYGSPFSNQSATSPFATDAPRLLTRLSGLF